jgi:large repetitive protein
MRELYTKLWKMSSKAVALLACCVCVSATATGQVGLVWGVSDYSSTITMSSGEQEITYDITTADNKVYALVGKGNTLDGDVKKLYLYTYSSDGVLLDKKDLTSGATSSLSFPIPTLTCETTRSFDPSRKLHLEIYGTSAYVAGSVQGVTGSQFLGAGEPKIPTSGSILFVAKFNITSGALEKHSFITKDQTGSSNVTSFITDMDIDPDNGNVHIVGHARESFTCQINIGTIPYFPPVFLPGPAFALRPEADSLPDSLSVPVIDTTLTLDTTNNNGGFGGTLKSSALFSLRFFRNGVIYTNTVLANDTLKSAQPAQVGTCESTTGFTGEINFWAAYQPDLNAFVSGINKPKHVLMPQSSIGTVMVNAISIDQSAVYVCGHFSRPDSLCDPAPTNPYYDLNVVPYVNLFQPTPIYGVGADAGKMTFARNGFIVKFNKSNGSTSFKKAIRSVAASQFQDILVDNDKIYALFQVASITTDSTLGAPRDTVWFRGPNDYFSGSYSSYYNYHNNTGLQNKKGLFLVQIANSGASERQAVIERYQEISSSNTFIPTAYSDNIQIDAVGNIYVANLFAGTLDAKSIAKLPSGVAPVNIPAAATSNGGVDIAVTKYSPTWQHIWTKSVGGAGFDGMVSIRANEDGFYMGGGFEAIVDLEPAPALTYSVSSRGQHDAFLAKYGCYNVQINQPATQACEGTPVTLVATNNCPYGDACNLNYVWTDPVLNNSFPAQFNQYIFLPVVGTNTRLLAATEANTGCIMFDTLEITANQAVSVTSLPTNAQICSGSSLLFSAATNLSGASYKWYYNNNPAPVDTTNAVLATIAGAYRVEATVNGCKSSATSILNQFTAQNPRIVPDTALLCGGSTTLEVLDCAGCTFNWSPPLGSGVSSNTNTIQAPLQGTYLANVVDNNNCSYLLSKNVLSSTYLQPTIISRNADGEPVSIICNNEPLIIETTPYCPTCTYLWNNGSTANFTFAFTGGNYQVTVVNNATACSGVSNLIAVSATTLSNPSVAALPGNICADISSVSPAIFEVDNICPGCYYRWYENDTILNNVVAIGTSIPITNPGDYVLRVSDIDNCSAYSSVIQVTTQNTAPPTITTNHQRLCGMNTSTLSTLSCVGCTYQWYTQTASSQLLIPGATSPNYIASAAGTYVVEVSYSNGCKRASNPFVLQNGTFTVQTDVNPAIPKFICNGASVLLNMTGSYQLSPAWQYQWFRNGVAIPNAIGYSYAATQPGSYYIKVINQDSCVATSLKDTVIAVSAGANPFLSATPSVICATQQALLNVVTNPCSTCYYGWRLDDNSLESFGRVDTYQTSVIRGYYVSVVDTVSNCIYNSNVVQIRDTFLPSPILTSLTNPTCSPLGIGVLLSTTPQPGSQYIWYYGTSADTTAQNTFVATSYSGPYHVRIKQGDCISTPSNDIPVSFSSFNAQIFAASAPIICNGDSVQLFTTPKSSGANPPTLGTSCVNCDFRWFNDNVLISNPLGNNSVYNARGAGDYFAVVTDTTGCTDTTTTISVAEANITALLQTSTTQAGDSAYVCGATNPTTMFVNSCVGCSYSWFYGVASYATSNFINTQTDTAYTVVGGASAGFYIVEINNNGCIQRDSVELVPTPAFLDTITINPIHGNICAGTPVAMTGGNSSVTRRWVRDALPIPGILAEQASYQTTIAGTYTLISTDSRGCIDTTDAVTLIESNPAPGFALNFNALNPVPITTPAINLDDYLQPVATRTGSGRYTSLTATSAIDTLLETFNPSIAGAGLHIIYYHDTIGACVFTVSDTIEILQSTNVDIQNRRLNHLIANNIASCPSGGCPAYEACLQDSMRVIISNFPFVPTSVQFVTDTGYITIPVTSVLNPVGSVWSGYIPVIVPSNARTGKLRLRNGVDVFQTGFFLVVQNPAVSMDLVGVTQPLCSNNPIAALTAVPVTGATGVGTFTAAYASAPNTVVPALLSSAAPYHPTTNPVNIAVNNITGYDLTGRQDLLVKYSFQPVYTGTTITCPSALTASKPIEVRNVDLTSIEYTPISMTQANESMFNMTRLVQPLASRVFTGSYTGTYINANGILPVTISAGWGPQPVTYHISNSTCTNTVVDTVRVLPSPSLSVIPDYVCRKPNDTIWIGRNVSGPYVTRNGTTTQFDPLYNYQNNIVSNPNYGYVENIHLMTLTSSNGGLVPFNLGNGQERYALVPSSITGNTTTLTLTYRYNRVTNYFDATSVIDPTDTADYVIAQIERVVNFEDLPAVLLNPAILAAPVFCKENTFIQFSGTPNGGQSYVFNGAGTNIRAVGAPRVIDTLQNNLFNPTDYLTPTSVNDLQLRYVFTGNACKDSAQTTISIAAPFNITLTSSSAPVFCEEEPNDNITISSNIQTPNALNMATGLFYVGGVQSGQVFSPSLRGPGTYPVSYVVSDIYGCQAKDSTTFVVHPTPILTMSVLAPIYCANDPIIPIQIFSNSVDITANYAGNIVTLLGNGVVNGGTSLTAAGAAPFFYPLQSTNTRRDTTVRDTVRYTLVDLNGCTATITDNLLIRELPSLLLTLPGGEAIPNSFCEGDTAQIIGSPLGGAFSNVATTPTGHAFSLNASTGVFTPAIVGATPNSITEEYLYTFANNATGCRDTIRDTITILNRAEVTITGLPSLTCASDTTLNLGIISNGAAVTTGIFSAFPSTSVRMDNPSTPSAFFYPDSAGVTSTQLTIGVRLSYVSNGCNSRADTFIVLNPLPQLTFNIPGDTLAGGGFDRRFHICESADSVPLYAYNFYNGNNLPIFPETGVFVARGVRFFGAPTNRYIYFARDAVFGPDTIVYTYTDPRGCTNIATNLTVVDTVPALGFAGFAPNRQVSSNPDFFSYCANDAPELIVPSPFGGLLYFQQQLQQNGVFDFVPSQLATPTATTYEVGYTYIARRYANGRVCQDSIKSYVEVKPIPILNFVGVPNEICVSSLADRFTLQATPVGGLFRDVNVTGGILADSIFDPFAQFGLRSIIYWYTDPATNCSDTIEHDISVYRVPTVSFSTGGGCEGDPITLVPASTGLVYTPPSLDSITHYIWTYGDGTIDTVLNTGDPVVVPNRNYPYAANGIYFPQLTVINRFVCSATHEERIVVSPKVTVTPLLPYTQDFTADPGNWFQETVSDPTDSLWQWGWATGSRITTAQAENNVWVTRAADPYQAADRGWVYSPCFDISTLRKPMFAMDAWTDTREGVDGAVVEYFHPTRGWTVLGERDKGINWYDSLYLISAPGMQLDSPQYAPIGWSGENVDGFRSVRYRLDTDRRNGDLRGMNNVRFRVAFAAADNTDANGREGFAFDNVYVGERGRSVLVEHFSNQNIPGIASLENRLYQLIYSNLYGRDVTLLQFQTPLGGVDSYYSQAEAEGNARMLTYSISTDAKKIRINGQNFVSTTDDLVDNIDDAQEYLDMQMLESPSFKITIPTVPQIFQASTGATTGTAAVVVEVEALKDMTFDNYIVHAVITEDSLRSTQRHYMKSVVRAMLADVAIVSGGTSGTPFLQSFAAGDVVPVTLNWSFLTSDYRRTNLRMNVFIQNGATKEVYQVATSRDLTVFNGPVNVEELPMAEGKEIIDFKLYPNPAQDYFVIEFNQPLEGEYDWQVVDMLGRVLHQGKAQAGDRTIEVQTERFASGMYIFSIHNENVYSQRQAIIARP